MNLHDHIYRRAILNVRQGMSYDQYSHQIEAQSDSYLTLMAAKHAFAQMRMGVTTIREVGSRSFLTMALRKAINEGELAGPRLFLSGRCLCMTGGHGHYICLEADGADAFRRAARQQLKAGADWIKIVATGGILGFPHESPDQPQLTFEEMSAAIEEAHKMGKRATAHADATRGIKEAVRAGVDCIEHGVFIDAEGIQMMVDHGVFLVATLSGVKNYVLYEREVGHHQIADTLMDLVVKPHADALMRCVDKGVRIGCGTDTRGWVHEELELMHEAGLDTLQCIRAGTLGSAEVLGREKDLGSIEVGKLADLVLLDDDPVRDMRNIRTVLAVYKGGELIGDLFPHAEWAE
jgi:imidazolonepropionase-like amidohydrolase